MDDYSPMMTPRLPLLLLVCAGCSLALSTDEYREPQVGDSGPPADTNDLQDSLVTDARSGDTGDTDSGVEDANVPEIDGCVPSPEMCNGVNDDCDGTVDEDTCSAPNTEAMCQAGGCVVTGCDSGYSDCSDETAGCETAWDRLNCGDCGDVCMATEACEAGTCVEQTLDWWWTVDQGVGDSEAFISSGLTQNYILTRNPQNGNPSLTLTSSSGSVITFSDGVRNVAVLVALDETGSELWRVLLSAARLRTTAISSIEGANGVYIAGNFRGALRADGPGTDVAMSSVGTNNDAFVLRIDVAGNVQRLAQVTDRIGGDGSQSLRDMVVSPDGTVFAIGTSNTDFATGIGRGSALGDSEVPSGTFQFILRVGSSNDVAISTPRGFWESVAADNDNVYVAMRLEGSITLGGVEYEDERFVPFIVAFNHDLELQWAEAPLAPGDGQGEDSFVRLHAGNERLYVSHSFDAMHSFGGSMVGPGGYVASLAPADGSVAWARQLGMSTPAIDSTRDEVHFAGAVSGEVDLGGRRLINTKTVDAFFGALEPSGVYSSARRFGGLSADRANGVQGTSTGTMVAGEWFTAMTVDGETLDTSGDRDLFVLHFSAGE
ncbi:MAG: hypothetical protein AB8H86_03290 [Polyangiales bacterium]